MKTLGDLKSGEKVVILRNGKIEENTIFIIEHYNKNCVYIQVENDLKEKYGYRIGERSFRCDKDLYTFKVFGIVIAANKESLKYGIKKEINDKLNYYSNQLNKINNL